VNKAKKKIKMSNFLERIEELSPEKRELLNLFLQEESTEVQENYVAPSTPFEEKLASIWSQVLGIEQVGIYDNFFELGGDSIQSIQIIAKVNQAGFQFTTNQLFEYPTIADLARILETSLITLTNHETGQVTAPIIPLQNSQSPNRVSFTPDDFPEAELSQEELNQLFNQYEN
jgi:acyl carrier protein